MPSMRPWRTNPLLLTVLTTILVSMTATCSSSPSTTPPTSGVEPTDTAPDATAAARLAAPGPHPVGFTRATLDDGRQVVVWYPSTDDAVAGRPNQQIDLVGFLADDLQAKIPAEDRVVYPVAAAEDAAAWETPGGHPVVVFSHGLAGFPEQSASLVAHLASWGYLVAAPEHVDRSLGGLLGDAAAEVTGTADDVEVIRTTLEWLRERANRSDGRLAGLVSADRAAAAGHSRGATAAYLAAAEDDRFDAFIAYSVDLSDHVTDGATHPVPAVPGMVMTGTADGVNAPAASRHAFDTLGSPSYLIEIEGAGHLVFSDICEIGKERGGIVALARTLDLPIPEDLLSLGTDGCGDAFPPVTEAFDAIHAASVAFLDLTLGGRGGDDDPRAQGVLATGPLSALGTPVTVEVD